MIKKITPKEVYIDAYIREWKEWEPSLSEDDIRQTMDFTWNKLIQPLLDSGKIELSDNIVGIEFKETKAVFKGSDNG